MITVLAKVMRHVPIVREATSASAQPALKEKIVGKVKGPIFYVTDVGPKATRRASCFPSQILTNVITVLAKMMPHQPIVREAS